MEQYELQTELLNTIKKLRAYGIEDENQNKIVLAAPAYGTAPKFEPQHYLRAYMCGGDVGKIALDGSVMTIGIKCEQYAHKYKGIIPEEARILDPSSSATETSRLKAIVSDKYLKYAVAATAAYSLKSDENSEKERLVETMIMDYRYQHSGSAAVDMEMQYSGRDHMGWTRDRKPGCHYVVEREHLGKTWYNEYEFAPDDTFSPRVDLMVLDEGIGFVELKVDNENCENLESHINHMRYILTHKDIFAADAERRLDVLNRCGLLENEMLYNLEKWRVTNDIWCGILFVGQQGQVEESKEMIKTYKTQMGNDIKCAFVGLDVIKAHRLKLDSKVFLTTDMFMAEYYKGIFNNEREVEDNAF